MKTGIIGLILLLSALLSSVGHAASKRDLQIAANSFERGTKLALLVGYDGADSGFSRLKYTTSDVNEMSAELGRQNYRITRLLNTSASKERVLNYIRNDLPKLIKGDTTLVFHFSGHGYLIGDKNYLATYEASADDLEHTGLSVKDLIDAINSAGVTRAILFIDACRNDPRKGFARGFIGDNPGKGMQILYSTEHTSTSWESPDLNHGVFTYFLLKGLRGDAANTGGVVDFATLAKYVEFNVPRWTERNPDIKTPQYPFQSSPIDYYGDFILASRVKGSSSTGGDPIGSSDDSAPQDLSTEESKQDQATQQYLSDQEAKQRKMEAEQQLARQKIDAQRGQQASIEEKKKNDRLAYLHQQKLKQQQIDENKKRKLRTTNQARKRVAKLAENRYKEQVRATKRQQQYQR